jgi:hypothetical protein
MRGVRALPEMPCAGTILEPHTRPTRWLRPADQRLPGLRPPGPGCVNRPPPSRARRWNGGRIGIHEAEQLAKLVCQVQVAIGLERTSRRPRRPFEAVRSSRVLNLSAPPRGFADQDRIRID